jgi:multiple sugar transport system permease protein
MHLKKNLLPPAILITPAILVLIVVAIYPFLYGIFLSLHSWDLGGSLKNKEFIGLANYINIFKSEYFWNSLRISIIYTVSSVSVEMILGLAIAMFLNLDFPGRNLVRSIVIIPLTITPVVVGLIWRVLYNTEYGIFNFILNELGLPVGKWIAGVHTALASIIIVDIWQWTPFVILIFMAGLSSIPVQLYEAGKIDGGSALMRFWYITLPCMKQSILIVLLFRTIDAFKIFDNVFVLTNGGPGIVTENLSMHVYIQGFRNRHMGYASALGLLLLAIIIFLSQLFLKALNKNDDCEIESKKKKKTKHEITYT